MTEDTQIQTVNIKFPVEREYYFRSTTNFAFISLHRVAVDWVLSSSGRQEMAGDTRTVVTVMDTQTVFTLYQSVQPPIMASHLGTQRAAPLLWPLHSVAEHTEKKEL